MRPRLLVGVLVLWASCAWPMCWWDIDFDGDTEITFDDFFLFADRFGTQAGDALWDPRYDLLPNGIVDMDDMYVLADWWPVGPNSYSVDVCGGVWVW